tara:strand:+ start:1610 stop:2011 length:402 start_codon:yes stop_codon:yes gene_type:complete
MNQAQLMKALAAAILGGATVSTKKGKSAKKARGHQKLTEAEKADYRASNNAEAVKLFTAKGAVGLTPDNVREFVMTYDKWLDQGRRVRKGEKSTKVGAFSLFHVSQTDPVPAVAQATNVVAMPQVHPEATVVH